MCSKSYSLSRYFFKNFWISSYFMIIKKYVLYSMNLNQDVLHLPFYQHKLCCLIDIHKSWSLEIVRFPMDAHFQR